MAISTPWGSAQSVHHIAHGIRSVSTAGHGGVLVSPTKNKLIPEYMRHESGAYEEDCDWCKVAVALEAEWRAWADTTSWTTGDFQMECAFNSLRNWFPEEYEKFTGKQIQLGESYVRDQAMLDAQTRDKYVNRAAWGDWHADVPKGMVAVFAQRESDGNEKHFLVTKEEYNDRNTAIGKASCFVVDPGIHKEIAPILH